MSPTMRSCVTLSLVVVLIGGAAEAAQLRVPGFTAYLDPAEGHARVHERRGVVRWNDSKQSVTWFGRLASAGSVRAAVEVRLADGAASQLRLTVGATSREATVQGSATGPTTVDFGEFSIAQAGYCAFRLENLHATGHDAGQVEALVLEGDPLEGAHFNLQPRRNAASVHLAYPIPAGAEVDAFYCEMTGLEDPLWTYYMACGWHRGYFGMQVNSPTERRIIFSVWDSGDEAIDRDKVAAADRVTLVDKGADVYTGSFGNEGTGGHSHLKFPWKTGEVQRFLVTADPVDATHTVFAGYYFRPDLHEWMLISSWKAPKEGGYLRGLYSFSENFAGENGHVLRKALYGNQWLRTSDGVWREITTASFSHDPTGRRDRLDRFMGVEQEQFFLSHGGFVAGETPYGTKFERSSSGRSPADMPLPPLP